MSGKGDTPRPYDAAKFRSEWERIFEKRPPTPPDAVMTAQEAGAYIREQLLGREAMDEHTRLSFPETPRFPAQETTRVREIGGTYFEVEVVYGERTDEEGPPA